MKYKKRMISMLIISSFSITATANAWTTTPNGHPFSDAAFTYNSDNLPSGYAPSFQSAVSAWYSTPTPLTYSSTDIVNAEIKLYAGYYGNTGWNAQTSHHSTSFSSYDYMDEIRANYDAMNYMTYQEKQGVFAHELGHVLGLDHVSDQYQIMCTWGNNRKVYVPGADDIAGANALY